MPDIPWEMISKSQRAAVGMFTGSVSKLVDMGKTGVTRPDELLHEVTAMASAMSSLVRYASAPCGRSDKPLPRPSNVMTR